MGCDMAGDRIYAVFPASPYQVTALYGFFADSLKEGRDLRYVKALQLLTQGGKDDTSVSNNEGAEFHRVA